MTSARPRRRGSKPRRGWAALDRFATHGNPVPGDVLGCLEELGILVTDIKIDEAQARCLAHAERTGREDGHPSWSVNIDSGLFGCWSCGWKGNFVQLVAYALDLDQGEAAAWVRARGAIEYVKRRLAPREELQQRPQMSEPDLALFVDPPSEALASRLVTVQACRAYGVLWDGQRQMWITPIRDEHGTLVGWQEKNARHFRNRPYGSDGRRRCVFGLHRFPGGLAIVTESPLDPARILAAGHEGGLSTFGTQVTDHQLGLIIQYADEVCWAMDNDADGRRATADLLGRAAGRIKQSVWNYGDSTAKDPGEQSADEVGRSLRTRVSAVRAQAALRKAGTC